MAAVAAAARGETSSPTSEKVLRARRRDELLHGLSASSVSFTRDIARPEQFGGLINVRGYTDKTPARRGSKVLILKRLTACVSSTALLLGTQ